MSTKAVAPERRNRAGLLAVVGQHPDRLHRFVGHEVAYLEAVGDLIPGELTPDEVVDTTLLRGYRELVKGGVSRDVGGRLLRMAIEQLDAEVVRSKAERARTIHIEEDVPETPPAERVSTLGDETLDFHEPDEDLRVEDVIPDLKIPTPQQEAEMAELRRCVQRALARLPRAWRRGLLLRYANGLTRPELARTMGRPEAEIDGMLEDARRCLRQQLLEAGCEFAGEGRRAG